MAGISWNWWFTGGLPTPDGKPPNFVDPDRRAHTQSIEGTWRKFKANQKEMFGIHNAHLEDYFQECMWRNMFGRSAKNQSQSSRNQAH